MVMLSRRSVARQPSWLSPMSQRPNLSQSPPRLSPMSHRPNISHSPPPPVQALEYPSRPQDPVLVLPGRTTTPPEENMVLTWPSQETRSQEFTESGSVASPDGRATYHARAIVTVSPSGETTMHIQSSYYSVRSPAGGSGGTRLHHSPGSGGARSYSTPSRSVKQLTFPGGSGSQFGTPQSSRIRTPQSFGTPRTALGVSPLANSTNDFPKPGRKLAIEDSPAAGEHTVRRRNLPLRGGGDATPHRNIGMKDRSQVGDLKDVKKTCSDKGYKGILEQDHPEELNRGRGAFCSFICTACSLILLVLLILLLIWLFFPFGDPVLTIGMAPTDAISTLKSTLQNNVFGQHIANSIVVSALSGLLIGHTDPVIMSFHGSTGVGKTHMADILSKHFKEDGSMCSHTFLTDFHISTMDLLSATAYERVILNWVKNQVKQRSCEKLFLVFDELRTDAPLELAMAVSNVISEIKLQNLGGNQDIVFIIMSDIGMHDINAHMTGLWDNGSPRDNTTVDELDLLIKNAAMYLDNSPQQTDSQLEWHYQDKGPISALLSLIDFVIPFLPLERDHVKLCVIRDVIGKGARLSEDDIAWVVDQLTYFPASSQVFSMSGCKKVPEKVDLLRSHYEHR